MKLLILLITTILVADQSYEDGLTYLKQRKVHEAFESFSKSSSIEAKHELGTMYLNGVYVDENKTKAFSLYMEGVEKKYARSFNNAGLLLKNGIGVPIDRERGCSYFKKAAEQDLKQGYFNYGVCLYEDKQFKESLPYFENALKQGSPLALEYLGKIYDHGVPGIDKNRKKAIMYYVESVNSGGAGINRLKEMKRECFIKRVSGCEILDRLYSL